MNKILKTIGSLEFFLFVINLFSSQLFGFVQTAISKCDPFAFKSICMIITYIIVHYFINKKKTNKK